MIRNTLLFLFIVITQFAFAQTWVQKASMPSGGGLSPIYFTINGKLYAGGGYFNSLTSDFYEYDPTSNVWTKKADMPVVNYSPASFVLNGKGYVVGGNNSSVTYTSVYRYDPVLDTWQTLNDIPASGRMAAIGFVVNNTAYICGGYFGGATATNETWQYDPVNDSWIAKAPIPGPARNHASYFVVNDTAYVGLACNAPGSAFYNDMYRYNPQSDSWTPIALFPSARVAAGGFSLNGKGYIVCGLASGNYFSDFYEYNTVTNTWKELCPFNGGGRSHILSLVVNGEAYIGAGALSPNTFSQQLWQLTLDSLEADFSFTNLNCSSTIGFQNNSTGTQQFQWIFGDGDTSTSSNPSHTYTSNGNYNVKLVAYGNCRNDTIEKVVTVGSSIIPTASFTINNTSCSSSVQFQNTSQNASSYRWNFGDASPEVTTQNATHNFSSSGTYTVSLIASNACGSDTFTQPVTIASVPAPVALFSLDTTSCSAVVTFNNFSLNQTSQQWLFGDGNVSSALSPNHTYTSSGSYTVTLIASNSCSSDTNSLTFYLDPFTAPVVDFSIQPNACNLTVSPVNNSTEATSYIWDFGNALPVDTATSPSHTFPTSGTYTIALVALNNCGTDTASQPVTVTNIPPATALFTADTTACSSLVTFNNLSTNQDTQLWFFGDGGSDTLQNPSHSYTVAGSYSVILIVENACSVDTFTSTLNLLPFLQPVADFNALSSPCSFDVALDNNSANGLTYQWAFGDGNTSTDENPRHTYTSQDSFLIQLTATNDCGMDSISKIFTPDLTPGIADFDVVAVPCSQDITIKNKSSNAFSYFWSFGDNTTDSTSITKHTYLTTGTYNVQLFVNQGTLCEDELTKSVTLSEEQGAIFIPNMFSPNEDGSNDIFKILGVKECLPFELTIFNRWGEMVFKSTDRKIGWDGFYKGKPQPAGVFVYTLYAIGKKYKGSITLIR